MGVVRGGASGVLNPTQLLSTSVASVIVAVDVFGLVSYFFSVQIDLRSSKSLEATMLLLFGVSLFFFVLLVILSRIIRNFSFTGFLIDSLNVELMDDIDVIDALGSTVELLRLVRSILASGVFIAAKLIVRRKFRVIDPVRVSLGRFSEPGANESVEAKEILSKLSSIRLRLMQGSLHVDIISNTLSSSSSSSAIRCNDSSCIRLVFAIGEMSFGFKKPDSSFFDTSITPSDAGIASGGGGDEASSPCSSFSSRDMKVCASCTTTFKFSTFISFCVVLLVVAL